MDVFEAIAKRHSVRAFSDKPVSHIDMQLLVDAGAAAAKAGAVRFVAVTKREAIEAMQTAAKEIMLSSGNDFLVMRASAPGFESLYDAPAAVVVATADSADPVQMAMGTASCAAAAQNVMLAATGIGLGSCYTASTAMALSVPGVAEAVGLPEGMRAVCVIAVGVPAEGDIAPDRATADAVWCE